MSVRDHISYLSLDKKQFKKDEDAASEQRSSPSHREVYFPSAQGDMKRAVDPELPESVTILATDDGCKVYLVGTAHFSNESQDDVVKTIQAVKPDNVLVELCQSRVLILQLDEETLMKEAKSLDFNKFRTSLKQNGLMQAVMHLLFLSMSAHLTEQLGMAPGGEFRTAYREAKKIDGCGFHLGDRPIQITLQRALGSLSLFQKLRLAFHIITSKDTISKEEVERCKNRDLLEEMLREMAGDFPALSQVFVTERDLYLAKALRSLAKPVSSPLTGPVPSVLVGVVGIGHTPGIIKNWDIVQDLDIRPLLTVPKPSKAAVVAKWAVRAAVVGGVAWAGFRTVRLVLHYVK